MPLLMAPTTLTGALSVVLIPEIATIKHDDKSAMSARIDGSINFAIIIAALFTILYIPLGKEITSFVFKDEFSGVYLSNVALMLYPLGLNQISTSILNSMGLERNLFQLRRRRGDTYDSDARAAEVRRNLRCRDRGRGGKRRHVFSEP